MRAAGFYLVSNPGGRSESMMSNLAPMGRSSRKSWRPSRSERRRLVHECTSLEARYTSKGEDLLGMALETN